MNAAGREWIVRGALDRAQVRELLTETLTALVEDVLPRILPRQGPAVPGQGAGGVSGG